METVPGQNNQQSLLCKHSQDTCHFFSEIVSLRKEVDLLTELVRSDALTGLYNFRFFNETIALEMERTRRGTQPLSMILLDIDYFKKFNDEWGHDIGNHALVHIAKLIKVAVRKLDLPCRFGGEEFVILLPNTDLRQAVNVAERLREMISSTPVQTDGGESIAITASLGVDQFASTNSESSDEFVKRVDLWLYKSKHNGRNQVSHPDLTNKLPVESVTQEEKYALFGAVDNKE